MEKGKDEFVSLTKRVGGRLSRRDLMRTSGAFAAATAAMKFGMAGAQDATPAASPAGPGVVIKSMTREEWDAKFAEAFPMTPAENTGGKVIRGDSSDIKTVNAILGDDSPTLDIIGMMFDSLVGNDPNTGLPVPSGLADSWELDADGLTYTFHLNPNVKWHDGTPFTANDVAFSFQVEMDPNSGSSYTGTFVNAVASYKVVDDNTFQVVATGINADFLLDACVYGIMPKHIWENVPLDQWKTDGGSTGQDPARVVGTGPFKFKEWIQGDHVTLEKNPDYYQAAAVPKFDEFIYQVTPNDSATVLALKNGEIDLQDRVPAPDVEDIQNTEGAGVLIYPSFSFNFYAYNLDTAKTDLFQDVEVRQALMYGQDRESMANDIYLGYNEVANGTQPLLSFAYAPDEVETVYNFDPDKAKQLLESAGWVDSDGDGIREKNGKKLSFKLSYPTGSPTTDQVVAYYQEAWKTIGVEMEPAGVEFPQLVEIITSTFDFDIAMLGFNWDATGNQGPMFNCDQYKVGFNFSKYCNAKVDELNNAAKTELDQEKRRQLLIQSMNIVNNELPVCITLFVNSRTGYSKRLQNYTATGAGNINSFLPYVWIKE
jgi:peptide/nickel transport system substrate-binding protein